MVFGVDVSTKSTLDFSVIESNYNRQSQVAEYQDPTGMVFERAAETCFREHDTTTSYMTGYFYDYKTKPGDCGGP
jgi:hypothetical protein